MNDDTHDYVIRHPRVSCLFGKEVVTVFGRASEALTKRLSKSRTLKGKSTYKSQNRNRDSLWHHPHCIQDSLLELLYIFIAISHGLEGILLAAQHIFRHEVLTNIVR